MIDQSRFSGILNLDQFWNSNGVWIAVRIMQNVQVYELAVDGILSR